ncbi:synaptic vesicle glycoprotein 2C-like [Macrosteles quadrilineatus]|uniref:synaptic vesicle glycoprotein 2C-like n=1 Tax=Macrosteles quadrilineatus TaxID=74068 RepID=UPI0023E29DDC|nr:synaptic vesicle glycoprotein 2C-like [Macrosteles quadrilineatus]
MANRGRWSKSISSSTADILRVVSEVSIRHPHRQSLVPPENDVDYSVALDTIGTGRYHLWLALTCGFMYLAAGLQNNLNAYILPSVHCDLHITSAQMGLLNAVFLAGGIASNFLWGVIADVMGRKTVIVYGMLFDGILTLCSSFSQHFYLLLIFRFLNGFVVGGPSSVVFAYMGEFFPSADRTRWICYVGIFWTLSWVIMPGFAWMIIPLTLSVEWQGMVFNSWRLLVALMSLPSLTAAALHLCFPESPVFLLVQGKGDKALAILANIYAINNKCDPSEFSVTSLKMQDKTSDSESSKDSTLTVMVRQAKLLFNPSTVKITLLSSFLFFSNMYGYYGLGLWLPELFNRITVHLDHFPNNPATICSAGPASSTVQSPEQPFCNGTDVDTSVFIKSLVMGVIGLLGNIISGVLAGRLHRRTLPVLLMAMSGLCVVIIYFTTDLMTDLIIASAFQLTVGTANVVYNSLVVDMFPPNISGMGVCFSVLAGRLGGMLSNLAFGQLLDISCTIPIFLCALVLFAGSIVSFMIPKYPYSEREEVDSRSNTTDKRFGLVTIQTAEGKLWEKIFFNQGGIINELRRLGL